MQSVLKLIVATLLIFGLMFAGKTFFGPFAFVGIRELLEAAPNQWILFFELVILSTILVGFVLQELVSYAMVLSGKAHHRERGARWIDLAYLLFAVMASAGMYPALDRYLIPALPSQTGI